MADDLQALLDKIQNEGVKEAEAERDRILTAAKEEAERIRADAETDAKKTRENAEAEAKLLRQKGEEALRQAARDTLLSLRKQLEERLRRITKQAAGEALDADNIAALVVELASESAKAPDREGQVEILLPADQAEELQKGLFQKLRADLEEAPELKPVSSASSLEGGFQVRFEGEDVVYDFSDEALSEVLTQFLNPRLAAILNGEES
jgi:V/A-type H+-transporting ATPase subunit E